MCKLRKIVRWCFKFCSNDWCQPILLIEKKETAVCPVLKLRLLFTAEVSDPSLDVVDCARSNPDIRYFIRLLVSIPSNKSSWYTVGLPIFRDGSYTIVPMAHQHHFNCKRIPENPGKIQDAVANATTHDLNLWLFLGTPASFFPYYTHTSYPLGIQQMAIKNDPLLATFKTGWWFEPLWKILVNWDDYSQYMGK